MFRGDIQTGISDSQPKLLLASCSIFQHNILLIFDNKDIKPIGDILQVSSATNQNLEGRELQ